jgi:hypothetical protein
MTDDLNTRLRHGNTQVIGEPIDHREMWFVFVDTEFYPYGHTVEAASAGQAVVKVAGTDIDKGVAIFVAPLSSGYTLGEPLTEFDPRIH